MIFGSRAPFCPGLRGELHRGEPEGGLFAIWEDVDRFIRGYSKVACFTQDWELPNLVMLPDAVRGWAHLSLWAHYGAGHTGVCLRFDRERLLAAFEVARTNAVHQFHGPVRYRRAEIGVGLMASALSKLRNSGSMPSPFDMHWFIANESSFESMRIGPASPNSDWFEQTYRPNHTISTLLMHSLASCLGTHSRAIGFRPCSRC